MRKDKKYVILFGASFVLTFMLSIVLVSAISCVSDFNCPGQGQNVCKTDNTHHYMQLWQCSSGECVSQITSVVDCCLSSDCAKDQVCDITGFCKGGSTNPTCGDGIVQASEQCDLGNQNGGSVCNSVCQLVNNPNATNNNNLATTIIIALAIIVGFIILALILRRKKK